jgi:Fic family protein
MNSLENSILTYLENNPSSSSKEVFEGLDGTKGYATVKRCLTHLIELHYVSKEGAGKATTYRLSDSYAVTKPIDLDAYFEQDIDERIIQSSFNFSLIPETLARVELFTEHELKHLQALQKQFEAKTNVLSTNQYAKELERLAIDLSWKSSQIEGNTYSLLETEFLLKDKLTAAGKTQQEVTMLLNHKAAIDFIIDHPDYLIPMKVSAIEDIHRILVKDLGINRNIRNHKVGVTGTNYVPLDNDHQIIDALVQMCSLVNSKQSIFEKALLLLVLLSYIQAFDDGNKRTARIVSNACLIHYQYCPLSFRTVDPIEYKKAMLLFYEQNNISALKNLFIDQFEFAVNTYF